VLGEVVALIKCTECGKEVSDTAKACQNCGAKPKRGGGRLKYVGAFIALLLVLSVIASLSGQQPARGQVDSPPPKELPVDFDGPLHTAQGTLVCPASAAVDNREGHGLQAAMKSRVEVFGRQEDARKAGCEEWRGGITIQLADPERQQAKKWQAEHMCGMLSFDGGFVFSCSLQNDVSKTKNTAGGLKWNAPTTLSGVLKSGVYTDCCNNGEGRTENYLFLHLDSKVTMTQGDDADEEPGIDGVENIELGFASIPNVNEGQHIVVACKQIWFGNTGHYALPVFCEEPKLGDRAVTLPAKPAANSNAANVAGGYIPRRTDDARADCLGPWMEPYLGTDKYRATCDANVASIRKWLDNEKKPCDAISSLWLSDGINAINCVVDDTPDDGRGNRLIQYETRNGILRAVTALEWDFDRKQVLGY